MPHNTLLRKILSHQPSLTDTETRAAVEALLIDVTPLNPNDVIVRAGDRPERCCIVMDGYVVSSKVTDDGKRQILSINIAEDMPDLQSLHLHVMDHDIISLGSSTVGFVAHDALRRLTRSHPRVGEALWRETLIQAAIFREWILNVGRRSGGQRFLHLMVELHRRLSAIGKTNGRSFDLPMTQTDVGDALGMTAVHINRVLQELRKAELLDFRNKVVTLGDKKEVDNATKFNTLYLHQRAWD